MVETSPVLPARVAGTSRVSLVGRLLRASFAEPAQVLPPPFDALLARLAAAATRAADARFTADLVAITPRLRSFAAKLTGCRDAADDVVQQALMKAWASRHRFQPGTSFAAWMYTIARNEFLTAKRRGRHTAEWSDTVAERTLVAPAAQDKGLELADLSRALRQLPPVQREALLLVGAAELKYEEAAALIGCALGTIKSRVFRARVTAEALLEGHDWKRTSTDARAQAPLGEIMQTTSQILAARVVQSDT